jgi:lysophospholipase L1-like esterase
MKLNKVLLNIFLIIFPFLILEILSSIIIYNKEKKVGILFSLFNVEKTKQFNYKINWNKFNNGVVPGRYKHKLNGDRVVEYTINSKGFRGKEFENKKSKDFRIIAFGGSTTMGLESPDGFTYPDQLEKVFKDEDYNVEVLNFGLSSKSLNFIRELLFSETIKYSPNFITIYSARNPIMYDSIGTKIKVNEIKFPKIQKINLYLINNIMSYRFMFKIYRKILSSNIDTSKIISPYDQKVEHNIYYFTDQYFDTIKQIVAYAEKFEIKVALIKQATYFNPKIQKKIQNKSLSELITILQTLRKNDLYGLDYEESFWIISIAILNKNLEKFSEYQNVVIVDPVEALLSNKENFEDYLHLSIKGNKILADKIFESLKNIM